MHTYAVLGNEVLHVVANPTASPEAVIPPPIAPKLWSAKSTTASIFAGKLFTERNTSSPVLVDKPDAWKIQS